MGAKSFEELKATGALPSPPGVGLEILRLTARDDCSIDDLAAAIQVDPVLTSRLLQVANSALAGGTQPCTTVQAATMRLGLRTVRTVALGFSLVGAHKSGRCAAFDYDAFWSQSLARGVVAQTLAQRCGIRDAAELFVAGLLADLGTLTLATVHPFEFAEILGSAEAATPARRRQLEQQRFGIDHVEAGLALLREWQLPASLLDTIARADASPQAGRAVDGALVLCVAAHVARAFVASGAQPMVLDKARAALALLPAKSIGSATELWIELGKAWRRWGKLLDIATTDVPVLAEAEVAPAPLAKPAAAPVARPTAVSAPARMLVVDDDPVMLRLVTALLVREGHDVVTATNAADALRLAFEQMPQILVCDRSMPGMDGIDLVQRLRQFEAGRRVYVILLTSNNSEEQTIEGFDKGADDYVSKPFKPRILLARVRAALRVVNLQERVDADRVTMQRQLAELGVLARQLQQAAVTDQLTGIPNRRFAMDTLRDEWTRAHTSGLPLSVALVDVDRFKRINDTLGHAAGDAVLQAVARLLRDNVTTPGCACRIGGEEFLVVLPGADTAQATLAAEALRAAIAATPIQAPGGQCQVTASFGVATADVANENFEALLGRADQALYAAKNNGRDQVRCAPTASDRRAFRS